MIKDNCILKINTKNLLKNYYYFVKKNKKTVVAPAIKANAYGLGDKKVFSLLKKNKCNHFFVATLEEGIDINNINNNKKINIYVLNGIQNYNIKLFKKYNLIPIINTIAELKKIINKNLKFGIHIDTGINRLGINIDELPSSLIYVKDLCLIISHLASADEIKNNYNNLQLKRFINIEKRFRNNNILFSLANSNGSVLSKKYLFNMIRPGIALYGGSNKNKLLAKKLRPVVTLSGKVIQIKIINKNEYIGYNQTYKTSKKITVAIVGIGYADGMPRILSNIGEVYFKKDKYKIIGRISMDSFTIDISKTRYNIKVGTYIDLINSRYGIEDFAIKTNTISNEVLTSFGKRVKRIYV